MAKAKTAGAPKARKKSAKAGKAVALNAAPAAKKNKGGKSRSSTAKGVDALWKLAEHPLVSELLAIGATAAVATIAGQTAGKTAKGKKKGASKAALTAAGTAAAAAIGERLISEF